MWHLADWTEVSRTAITRRGRRESGGRKEEIEGAWNREGGRVLKEIERELRDSEWGEGIEAMEEREAKEKELSYPPLSQRSAAFQMSLKQWRRVHINCTGFFVQTPAGSLASRTISGGHYAITTKTRSLTSTANGLLDHVFEPKDLFVLNSFRRVDYWKFCYDF